MTICRRTALTTFLVLPVFGLARASELPKVLAYRNPGCGCCENWAKQIQEAGFDITMSDDPNLNFLRRALGVPESLAGCHLSLVGPYIVDGHVPSDDLIRLLDEQPNAMGLAVPGMPVGSPGMEADGKVEPFNVLIFYRDGTSKVFSTY